MSDWTLPKELDQPTPRIVKTRGTFLFLLLFQVGVMALILMTIGWTTAANYFTAEALKARGVSTFGTITRLYTVSGGKTGPHHNVAYAYPIANLTYSATDTTYLEQFNTLHIGDSVPVVYDPLKPTTSRLNFGNLVLTRDNMQILKNGAIVLLPTLLFLIALPLIFLVSYYRQKQLLQFGKATAAAITSDTEYNAGKAGRKALVAYAFSDDSGQRVTGKRAGLPLKGSRGDPMYTEMFGDPTVIYDPNNSRRNMLYPFAWVECVAKPESSLFSPP